MEFEHRHGLQGLMSDEYHVLVKAILDQHRGTMLDVAKGVFEYVEDLQQVFGPDVALADVREHLGTIRDLEKALDQFFTDRLTLRLLISHVQTLPRGDAQTKSGKLQAVGIVNANAEPIVLLSQAFAAAQSMCR
eukprot:1226728-Amphidinium_carterae.1